MTELDPVQLSRHLADALAAAGLPYAIGGAVAFGYWGPPRGTQRVDLNVFVSENETARIDGALRALQSAGVEGIEREEAHRRIREGAHLRGFAGRTPVDVFFDSIPLHRSAAARVVTKPLLGRPAWILSAEDLSVLKLLFFRGKDIVDVERLVALQAERLDRDYIRRWLVDCVGADDTRIETWDRISSAFPGDGPSMPDA